MQSYSSRRTSMYHLSEIHSQHKHSVLTRTVAGYVALVVSADVPYITRCFLTIDAKSALRYLVERYVCLDRRAAVQLTGHPISQIASWHCWVRQTSFSRVYDRSAHVSLQSKSPNQQAGEYRFQTKLLYFDSRVARCCTPFTQA